MLKPEFTVRRFGERYDRAEVDAFVERIVATVNRTASPALTTTELRTVAFRTPLLGAGYSAEEVDDFLSAAEQWMPDRPVAGQAPTGPERSSPMFTPVRLREGYDMEEVDEFVDRVMATVNGRPVERPVTAREIRKVQFSPVRMREGYDVLEVDLFLERAEEWLTRP
ncbi:DivIVA domain-containing protein [Kribbella swartbergensis]